MTAPVTDAILPTVNWDAEADFLLPPPDPTQRLETSPYPQSVLTARDRHRLNLHATLTAAGIPPHPDDTKAIDALSTLDDTVALAVRRWLTAGSSAPLT
ncbi:hypothetical protein OG453_38925 [Streptomyces sp. NBC_01381]|uniref:hypothetical protein n=1 Tax=Streptomyces sp. NBC_01381 TaxID=2903845 RepID=UPI002257159C|nr:hypothetical protein [Streptomyces sp. NBC_01381]MCX4672553.1 hypothetical protein [Streptomyces sp. NBC_01381]